MCRRMEEEGESEGVREAMKRKKRTEMERKEMRGNLRDRILKWRKIRWRKNGVKAVFRPILLVDKG